MTIKTLDRVNLRPSPEMGAPVIRTLAKDEVVTLRGGTAQCDDIDWVRVTTAKNEKGWCAKKYLSEERPALGKAIGIHIAGSGVIGDLLDVAERLHKASAPIPLAVVVSDPGLCQRIKDVSPATVVLYRWVTSDKDAGPFDNLKADGTGTVANGAAWFDQLWTRHSQAIGADFHQLKNECSFGGNGQSDLYAARVASFELEVMRRANERGVKVTIGDFMPGVPEQHHIDQMRAAFAFAETHGHALCYHAYTNRDADDTFTNGAAWYAMRWAEWVKPFPNLRVILGEAGRYNSPRFRTVGDMLRMMTELDSLLNPLRITGRDVRAAWWTIRGQDDIRWRLDDWTHALGNYEAWMKR